MEQTEVCIKAMESFMGDMKTPERARDNRLVYRTYSEEDVRNRM